MQISREDLQKAINAFLDKKQDYNLTAVACPYCGACFAELAMTASKDSPDNAVVLKGQFTITKRELLEHLANHN